jgi:DNA repair exonuclease SbcCD ATPase subunit
MLAKGDLEAALKELDAMGSALQEMLASLERTAGHPGRQNAALMKEMLELKRQLETLQAEQERLAAETERVKADYRRRVAERMQAAEERARRMAELAREARERVREAGKGVTMRSEEAFGMSRDRLQDLERALAMRDFDAALETVRRALPPMQRLATELEEDAFTAERYPGQRGREPAQAREAAQRAQGALPPAREVRQELERLFPDPRTVLAPGEQARLERQSRRQGELEREAGAMQRRLQDLMRQAPVFPPQAPQLVGESRGHMQQAVEELARRNPQRGHSQQRQALDALSRFRKGLEEMARRGGRGAGGGFPFPFAAADMGGGEEGSMGDPSGEKVEIPGADAHRSPEEFRRDLLEAMKQGAPEAYQAEVKRYYEELVR